MRPEVDLARVQHIPQSLVGTVCDRRVDDQHQASLEAPPQSIVPVLAINHLLSRSQHAFLLALRLRLLPRRHNRNRDSEHLRQRTRHRAQTQLHCRAGRLAARLHFAQIQRPHRRVPVKVRKVGARNADQAAGHAAVQPAQAFLLQDAGDGVQRAGVVRVVARVSQRIAGFGLHLHLQPGLDDVERVDEGVGYDGAGGAGDREAPGRDFCFGEGGHFFAVVFLFLFLFYCGDSGGRKSRFRVGEAIEVFCRLTMVSSAIGTALGVSENVRKI